MPFSFPILLIDDNPHMVDILNRVASLLFVEAEFIAVHSFAQAAAYLEGLHGRGPRLILLDVDLQSALNGFDFLSLLRGHPQVCSVPVVVLSANQSTNVANDAYQLRANVFTRKPDSYEGWKAYVSQLRAYWYATAAVPKLWFDKTAE
ncbi:response regulator [Spirosoma aerophilum]